MPDNENHAPSGDAFAGLSETELHVLYYIHKAGPAFVNKLAKRLNSGVDAVRRAVDALLRAGYLERVAGSTIEYHPVKRTKVSKHRNHAYYSLTRKGRHLFRRNDPGLNVNLRPPYKQA